MTVERGLEIAAWLAARPDYPPFVILDDDDDMGALAPYLVQTNPETGLTLIDAEKAIEIIRRQIHEPQTV